MKPAFKLIIIIKLNTNTNSNLNDENSFERNNQNNDIEIVEARVLDPETNSNRNITNVINAQQNTNTNNDQIVIPPPDQINPLIQLNPTSRLVNIINTLTTDELRIRAIEILIPLIPIEENQVGNNLPEETNRRGVNNNIINNDQRTSNEEMRNGMPDMITENNINYYRIYTLLSINDSSFDHITEYIRRHNRAYEDNDYISFETRRGRNQPNIIYRTYLRRHSVLIPHNHNLPFSRPQFNYSNGIHNTNMRVVRYLRRQRHRSPTHDSKNNN